MTRSARSFRHCLCAISLVVAGLAYGQAPNRALMRYPTLHGDTIVFVAHDNLWAVPRAGGTAVRLTAEDGRDVMPRFSPDGRWIAFTGEYAGNRDVYVMPAAGGPARRLTFTSDTTDEAPLRWGPNNLVITWTPDSDGVVFLSRREAWNEWFGRLFVVPRDGGLAQALPLDRGGLASYSPDGRQLAYNRIFRNFRTWKRYQGGLAQDIDIYDFASRRLTHITDWLGTETSPMWYRQTIYFLADHDSNFRANIWAYDLASRQFRQVTHFTAYDIDFPSLGSAGDEKAGIVFQQGGKLHVLDLPSEALHTLDVTVPDDGTRTSPHWVDARPQIRERDLARQIDFALAPNGKRVVFSARGDLFTVPVEYGNTRNLTLSSAADEDHPSWSPDGTLIAYTTDAGGEQQIAVRPAEGGVERTLTRFAAGQYYQPRWSPGADQLAFSDNEHRLWIVAVGGGEPRQVDLDPYEEIHDYAWSPDGRWLAYSKVDANQRRGLWIYDIANRRAKAISDADDDFAPAFDPNGKYLYFLSNRLETPTLSQADFDFATRKSTGIFVATLAASERSPLAPRSDEGAVGTPSNPSAKPADPATAGSGADATAKRKPGASKPITIDLEGLLSRLERLPIDAADIHDLDVRDDRVFYVTQPGQTIDGALPGEKPALRVYDLKARKDALLVEGASDYAISSDGTKMLYRLDKNYVVADAKPGAAATAPKGTPSEDGPKTLDLAHLRVLVDPRQEWAEMYGRAWRLERDFFFSTAMNGVDWPAVRARYAALVPLAGSRSDLNYLIGEMLGELGNSHTYAGGGDNMPESRRVGTAFLGVDFALDEASGRYRLAKIYAGDNSRERYRPPLHVPGVDVHDGDYLLAIDDLELKAPVDPFSLLVGKQDRTIKLVVADTPNGKRREAIVQPLKNEVALREKAWIDHNRTLVDRLSNDRIGYIYLSDMSALGLGQFIRQFYSQLDKRALIVDDRWNGGGFIDQFLLERLRRVLVGLVANRNRMVTTWTQKVLDGPKVCLINHYSASDGDSFAYYFRQYGLGPLIGTRTWGGVRGIRGYIDLLDGGYVTVPEDSMFGANSNWTIENHGVDPDIVVDDAPADWQAGRDPQLEAGVAYLLDALKKAPGGLPAPPPLLPPYPPGVPYPGAPAD